MIRSIMILLVILLYASQFAKAQETTEDKKTSSKKASTIVVYETDTPKEIPFKNRKKNKRKQEKSAFVNTIPPSEISWSFIKKKKNNTLANQIVAQDESGFFTWQGYEGYYYDTYPILKKFDHKGNFKNSAKLPGNYLDFVQFGKKLFYITYALQGDSLVRIQLQEINKQNCSLMGRAKTVYSYQNSNRNIFIPSDFSYRISSDNKYLLIAITSVKDKIKNNADNEISLVAVNQQLQTIWEISKIDLFNSNHYYLVDFELDHNGNVLLACQVLNPEGHVFELVTLRNQATKQQSVSIEFWNLTVVDMELSVTEDNRILVAGFYNNTSNNSRVKGLFMVELDTYHNEIKILYAEKFSIETISNMLDKRKISDLKEIDQIYLNKVITDEQGNFTLFAQRGNRSPIYGRYTESRTASIDDSNPESRSYGNLLIARISNQGKLLWTNTIRKNLITSYSQYRMGDFSAFNIAGKTRVFYYKGRFPGKSKPIILTTINNSTGKLTHEKLVISKQSNLFLCPRWFHIYGKENRLTMYSQMTNRYRYGTVLLK